MKYVLDSGVSFKIVIPEAHSNKAIRLRDEFQAGMHDLLSPDIFPGEVGHALTKAERQLRISVGDALRLWTKVMTTPPRLVPSLPFAHYVWQRWRRGWNHLSRLTGVRLRSRPIRRMRRNGSWRAFFHGR